MVINIRNLQKRVKVGRRLSRGLKKAVLGSFGNRKKGELTLCLVDDNTMKEINLFYHGSDRATDVLAFDISICTKKKKEILADIVISADTAFSNARAFKTSVEKEILLYAIHGSLHLIGYNDGTEEKRKRMEKKSMLILQNVYS